MNTQVLLKILEISKKKHGGEKELTIGHLLNIVKMVERVERRMEEKEILKDKDLINLVLSGDR